MGWSTTTASEQPFGSGEMALSGARHGFPPGLSAGLRFFDPSLSRWGFGPSPCGRLTTVAARTPSGFSKFGMGEIRLGWGPPMRRGRWCFAFRGSSDSSVADARPDIIGINRGFRRAGVTALTEIGFRWPVRPSPGPVLALLVRAPLGRFERLHTGGGYRPRMCPMATE